MDPRWKHPFTCIVAGPTGCGKTTFVARLQMRFTKYSSVYSTRQTKSFVMVQVRTNLKAMCLSVHGVKLWNTLPDDIKNCTSVNIFKKCIKKHFLSHY